MTFRQIFGPEDEDLGPLPPQFRFRRRRTLLAMGGWNRWIAIAVLLLLLFIVLNVLKSLYVDLLWFESVGYRGVYSTMVQTRILLFFGGVFLFLLYFGANIYYASRLALERPAINVSPAEAASLRRLYALGIIAGTIFLAVIFGTSAAGRWEVVLQYLNREPFGIEDPQFGRDIGFYVFTLPFLRAAYGWLMAVAILTTVGVGALYLFRYFVVGYSEAAVRRTRIHLSLLLVAVIALFIWNYWLERFDLNFSTAGVVFGATYTDVHARLPFLYAGMALGLVTIAAILYSMFRTSITIPATAMGLWIVVAIFGGSIYPASVQRLTVQPDELERERTYIQRNIEATRAAFGLDAIDERPYPASPTISGQEIADNPGTINNIRLLDVGPLLDTYTQIQTIRSLYQFNNIDIDRYVIDGVRRQVMISARELSSSLLPTTAQSWVNRRLQYTHGYGAVMSPVNEVVQEGLPNLFLKDIPVTGNIAITEPGIYYGEEPEHYVIVKTNAREFDYPEGDGNVQTVFEGEGGVQLSNIIRRAAFAWQFQDLNILLSGSLTSESRVLFVRNIQDRVHKLAPFLTLDKDPYLVIADGKMYWMQDAYATSSHYPYSTPAADGYNYIRNSVKAVIDAYDGSVTLYLVEPDEPITKVWAKIFPDLFTPASEMPASLQAHTRYPEDLFKIQVDQYRTYHIRDAGVLYNKEDIWQRPTVGGQAVEPYYVIMRLPGEAQPEFMLILPLTPNRRENTIAWVAARSDAPNYGKLVTYRFPTETQIFGPRQVESRIDQDPAISAQFSLWDTSGSNVIRGNLLMVPIGNGNLFIQPVYLQAESSRLPELKRVIVVNGNQIAMEPSLSRALDVIFGAVAPTPPTVDPNAPLTPASPGPSASPTAVPTQTSPQPTATPGGPPASLADLAREADAAFQRAQEALQRGDFAAYGVEIARVEELIAQIVQLTGP